MPLTTVSVSGFLTLPNGQILTNGRVVFTLTGVANDSGYMVPHAEVVVETGSDGSFSVNLWPNSRYEIPTTYSVVGYTYDESKYRNGKGYDFGKVVVPTSNVNISDILPLIVPNKDTYIMHRGDSASLPIILLDANNIPADISDSTVTASLSLNDFSVSVPVSKVPNRTGVIEIIIPSSVSSSLSLSTYTLTIYLSVAFRRSSVRAKVKVI